jgi:hypothetical protein
MLWFSLIILSSLPKPSLPSGEEPAHEATGAKPLVGSFAADIPVS